MVSCGLRSLDSSRKTFIMLHFCHGALPALCAVILCCAPRQDRVASLTIWSRPTFLDFHTCTDEDFAWAELHWWWPLSSALRNGYLAAGSSSPSRSAPGFHCCPLHVHDAPASLRLPLHKMPVQLVPHGMVLSADPTSDLESYMPVASRRRTQLSTLRIHGLVVFHTFYTQLDCADSVLQVHRCHAAVSFVHNASAALIELHLMTSLRVEIQPIRSSAPISLHPSSVL